ncbi:MAG: helix-hairpin-helix domain-containing protein [Bacteroidaceae bacterium]
MDKNSLKDWFYFSRSELRGLLVLSFLIIAGISFWFWIAHKQRVVVCETQQHDADYMRFKKGLKPLGWNDDSRFEDFNDEAIGLTSESYYSQRKRYKSGYWHKFKLFDFDPNTADSLTFIRLGLMPYMAHNIFRYRMKGKIFRKANDFASVYDLSSAHYASLLPYIHIGKAFQKVPKDTLSKPLALPFQKQEKYTKRVLLDLNMVDTTDLKKIPGIASGTARRIVNYRKRLGGFYTVNQLREVKYLGPHPDLETAPGKMESERIEDILAWFRIGSTPKRVLLINRFSVEHLAAHPYLNFYQAKVIVEHRKKRGDFHSLDELSLYEEFSSKDLERLKYYVQF